MYDLKAAVFQKMALGVEAALKRQIKNITCNVYYLSTSAHHYICEFLSASYQIEVENMSQFEPKKEHLREVIKLGKFKENGKSTYAL